MLIISIGYDSIMGVYIIQNYIQDASQSISYKHCYLFNIIKQLWHLLYKYTSQTTSLLDAYVIHITLMFVK